MVLNYLNLSRLDLSYFKIDKGRQDYPNGMSTMMKQKKQNYKMKFIDQLFVETLNIQTFQKQQLSNFEQFRNYKIIYKRYAGLFFAICVDVNDNELTSLELIHLYVEVLDKYFGNVCELDIVFNFNKAYGILDEMIIGGEVMETSKQVVINAVKNIELLD
ncbi:AP-2 complex subunit sigma [Paramecium bursaria]